MGRSDHGRMADPLSVTPDGGAARVAHAASPPGDASDRRGMARVSATVRGRKRSVQGSTRPVPPGVDGTSAGSPGTGTLVGGVSANGRARSDARAPGQRVRGPRDFK